MASRALESADRRLRLAQWVAREIVPHEARVRAWLSRNASSEDADELIQEAYCRLATLDSVEHIERPDAYFFSITRHLLLRRLRRQRIIPIETIAEIDSYRDESPTPERQMEERSDYDRLLAIIENLPERCRRIVKLRKVDGWSQRRIAEHMGTTEKAVEKQIWLGVRALRSAWSEDQQRVDDQLARVCWQVQSR